MSCQKLRLSHKIITVISTQKNKPSFFTEDPRIKQHKYIMIGIYMYIIVMNQY